RLGLFVTSQVCLRRVADPPEILRLPHNRSCLRLFRLDLEKSGIMRRPAFRHSNNQKYPIRKTYSIAR
ncbi:hypothetical protein, partial [Bifidobacterium ruminantium]|uniref:hypothetical protein n=1 Tax=Bifidobacterium ruminantium TaxID=78346 RepID=UPI001AE0574E